MAFALCSGRKSKNRPKRPCCGVIQRHFSRFPVEDLRVPLLNVVLWKPRRDELPSCINGVPRVTRGPAADWREGLARHPSLSRWNLATVCRRATSCVPTRAFSTSAAARKEQALSIWRNLGGDVVGIDSDRAAIQLARRRSGGARFVCGKPLPVLKELTRQFDLVVLDAAALCAASYTSQAELAALVCRRLARGGMVMIHSASESLLESASGPEWTAHDLRRGRGANPHRRKSHDGTVLASSGGPKWQID